MVDVPRDRFVRYRELTEIIDALAAERPDLLELTEIGRSLIDPLSALSSWAQTNLPAIEAARATNEDVEPAETI